MSGPDFFKTKMGRRFYEGTMPRLVEETSRLADALEEHNKLKRKELGLDDDDGDGTGD